MMVAGMAGRIVFGRIADRVGSLQTYIAASAGQTALAFLFPYAASGAQLYVLSALFGAGVQRRDDVISLLRARIRARRQDRPVASGW